MKLLQTEFTKKGTTYKQLEKNERYVLYQCTTTEGCTYYEIFKYRVKPYPIQWESTNTNGYTQYEVYPSDEEFGRCAWCCSSLDRAKKMITKHSL